MPDNNCNDSGCTANSAGTITAVENIAYVPGEFAALPEVWFAISWYDGHDPQVRCCKTLPGNAVQLLSEA